MRLKAIFDCYCVTPAVLTRTDPGLAGVGDAYGSEYKHTTAEGGTPLGSLGHAALRNCRQIIVLKWSERQNH